MTQSRLDFEEWARKGGYDIRHYFDEYYSSDTNHAWHGWRARDEDFLKLMEGK